MSNSAAALPRGESSGSLRSAMPAWFLSMAFHATALVLLAVLFNVAPRGTGDEETRTVGVVLKRADDDQHASEYYDGEGDSQRTVQAATDVAASALEQTPPSNPSDALPDSRDVLGLGSPAVGSGTAVGQMLNSPGGLRSLSGGKARTQVFGIAAEGYKFVYVFDRSASMGGSGGRNALNRAKAELLASLESLGETHQFQIIFYNEQPTIFSIAGIPTKPVFANETNKARAKAFIQGIVADGATQHEPALLAALGLNPDVIFFLTDAGHPELSPLQLRDFARRNSGGAIINVIEFGTGPVLGENFLGKLAQMNGGTYAYVNVARF